MAAIVILPTYNEVSNLEALVASIRETGSVDAMLVVDDNSPDGTGDLADEIAQRDSFLRVLHRPGKLGLGTAYQAGFEYAQDHGFDHILTMDADFSHHPEHLKELIALAETADLVIGSRYVDGGATVDWGFFRKVISSSANTAAIFLLQLPARDCTSGYRCYSTRILSDIRFAEIRSSGYSFLVEALYRVVQSGGRVAETPIIFRDRQLDRSKISRAEIVKGVLTLLRLRRSHRSGTTG